VKQSLCICAAIALLGILGLTCRCVPIAAGPVLVPMPDAGCLVDEQITAAHLIRDPATGQPKAFPGCDAGPDAR
jgi:hypothetical protein